MDADNTCTYFDGGFDSHFGFSGSHVRDRNMNFDAIFPTMAAAIAVALVLSWIDKKVSEHNPVGNPSITGTIQPRKSLIYFVLITGVLFCSLGILATIYLPDDMIVYGPATAFMGASFILFSIPGLTSIQDIHWTNEYLDGPSKVAFKIMGLSRTRLMWSDIAWAGLVNGGYYYVESKSHERIYWSRAYKDFEQFEATLAEKCPFLTLPEYEIHPK